MNSEFEKDREIIRNQFYALYDKSWSTLPDSITALRCNVMDILVLMEEGYYNGPVKIYNGHRAFCTIHDPEAGWCSCGQGNGGGN